MRQFESVVYSSPNLIGVTYIRMHHSLTHSLTNEKRKYLLSAENTVTSKITGHYI